MQHPPLDDAPLVMSGRVLSLMLRAVGIPHATFARFCLENRSRYGVRLPTSAKAVYRLTTERFLPDIYRTILRDFLGNELYKKWLRYLERKRPDLFSNYSPHISVIWDDNCD